MSAGVMRRRALAAVAAAALSLSIAACQSLRHSEPIAGPLVLEDPRLLQGRLHFDQHCYKCHLAGEGGMAPSLNDKPLPTWLMRLQVRLGLGAMPHFTQEQISDDELTALLDYVVALRRHDR